MTRHLRVYTAAALVVGLALCAAGHAEQTAGYPFGVLVGGVDVAGKMQIARELQARYYRTTHAVFTGSWKGENHECEAAKVAGLELVLTVRNGLGPGSPSSPPTDIAAYKRFVGEVLDKYKPALLVVENEENSKALFYDGTAEEYLAELKAASETARERGIKCANGGLVSSLVALLVADEYRKKGDGAKADAFLKRTLDKKHLEMAKKSERRMAEQIAKGRKLLEGYKAAGADFVNFHWYISDAAALKEAVAFLRDASGLPALCNEMGQQKNEDPAQVTAMMRTSLALDLPIVIWYSDDVPGYGEARALHNENGSLRPNGKAFKEFIKAIEPTKRSSTAKDAKDAKNDR